MRNCIEGFTEVQDSHVNLFVLVERREQILSCSIVENSDIPFWVCFESLS